METYMVFWFAVLQSKNSPSLESSCNSLSIQIFSYIMSCRRVNVISVDRASLQFPRSDSPWVQGLGVMFQKICAFINWNSAASLSCICGLFDEDFSNIEHKGSVDMAVVNLSFACQWIHGPNDFKLCFGCTKGPSFLYTSWNPVIKCLNLPFSLYNTCLKSVRYAAGHSYGLPVSLTDTNRLYYRAN